MGQYYKATNINGLQSVGTFQLGEAMATINKSKDKYEYSSGMKLMEHSWIGNHYVDFIMLLLSDEYTYGYNKGNGPWHKQSFAWVGDYSGSKQGNTSEDPTEEELNIYYNKLSPKEYSDFKETIEKYGPANYFDICNQISAEDLLTILKDNNPMPKLRYIVNDTKKLIIDLKELELHAKSLSKEDDEDVWIIHPLPLLTCVGNGRGGGDFRVDDPRVGSWFKDVIYTTNNIDNLEGYTIGNADDYLFEE